MHNTTNNTGHFPTWHLETCKATTRCPGDFAKPQSLHLSSYYLGVDAFLGRASASACTRRTGSIGGEPMYMGHGCTAATGCVCCVCPCCCCNYHITVCTDHIGSYSAKCMPMQLGQQQHGPCITISSRSRHVSSLGCLGRPVRAQSA